jgi:cell division protease FtsH
MNDENKKRSVWSYILPYLITTIFVVIVVFFAIKSLSSQSETWDASNIDTYFAYNVDNGTYDDISASEPHYYLQSYNATIKYQSVVTVTGVAYNASNVKDIHYFTVVIDPTLWENEWTTGTGAPHLSYSTIFYQKIEEWNNVVVAANANLPAGVIDASDPYQVDWWDTWGPTIIQIAVIGAITLFLFIKLNQSVNGSNRTAMDFNKSPARREDASKVRFTDVAGCDEEKAEMVEMVEYLKEPKKYSKFGARLPKGVLLIGPPGTGKTLLAKAVAGEAEVPFYSISGSDFVEMFVGVGAGRVRDLFKRAKQTAPCIIFIDEIDAVGRQRGAGLGGGNDEREQTLNQLLVEMDGFEYNSGILVMAATNRDDVLDPALLRPGRFDRIITVSLPNCAGREAIFKVHARNKKIDPSVDFHSLAKRTVGFSGADIENILNEAAILAVRFHKDSVGMAEIDEAIDRRIAGPAKSSKGMNDQERREVAFHEAGHAVIGLVLPYSEKVQKITIIPRGNTGGHVLMTPDDDRFILTKKELLAQITGLLGGRASEEIFFDDISTGAENDIQQATKLARAMVTEFGMSDLGPIQYEKSSSSVFLGRDYADTQKNFSIQIAFEIDKAVRQIIDSCHDEAKKILLAHAQEVTLIATTLLDKETITAEEIDSLVKTGKLPIKQVGVISEKNISAQEKAVLEGKVSAENQIKQDEERDAVASAQADGTAKAPETPKSDVPAKPADSSSQGESSDKDKK